MSSSLTARASAVVIAAIVAQSVAPAFAQQVLSGPPLPGNQQRQQRVAPAPQQQQQRDVRGGAPRRVGGNAAGAAVAAGIAGLVVGGIIASQGQRPVNNYPVDPYYPPEPYYQPPGVYSPYPPAPVYNDPGYAPAYYGPPAGSPEWYAYCARKYRSFDAGSGTFVDRRGNRQMCR